MPFIALQLIGLIIIFNRQALVTRLPAQAYGNWQMNREALLIEADELTGLIGNANLRLFDATVVLQDSELSAIERYRQQHIPGAVFLDHAAISDPDSELMFTLPNEQRLANAIGRLGISNENLVVVYSTDMIAWATRIWWLLKYAGHSNVRVLNGGLDAWTGERETVGNKYPSGKFTSSYDPDMFADREEVLAALSSISTCVVNTLPQEIYDGSMQTPYSGHITNSISHPFSELMDGNFLKPDEELRLYFAEKLNDKRLITYCGGGIAATLNACAAKLAGVEEVAVYDGSMTEWVHKGLPVSSNG